LFFCQKDDDHDRGEDDDNGDDDDKVSVAVTL
jgi:hypothetical protein